LIKYPKPTGDDMADTATRKKRANCDLEQIRDLIKTKKHLKEDSVVKQCFAIYKHPRYKRKPHDASIKAAIRREFRKLKGTKAPKRKGKKKVVRGEAGSGKTLRQEAPINFDDYFPSPRGRHTPPYDNPPPHNNHDPYGYKKYLQEKPKHPLGDISELSRKTDSELVAATEEMKDLIRKQNALVEDIRKLQDRKAKIDAFLNGKETLEILALLQQ